MTTPENTPGRTWARATRSALITITSVLPTERPTRPTRMEARWSEDAPAAIVLATEDPWKAERTVVEWVMARNTLVACHLPGLAGEIVGLGDVRVRYDAGTTTVWLSSPEGSCELAIPGEVLVDVLRDAAIMCPLGEAESAIYAEQIDRELAALVGGAQ